jgi:DNA-directed RNA polymerase subunit RPC12/RpoP
MPIEFSCPECAALIRTPDATAGKKGKCPNCATIVRIPGGATAVSPKAETPTSAAKPAAEQAETGPLEFFCSICGQIVRTPRSAAGKKGKCPQCNGVIQVPLKSRTVKGPVAASAAPAAPKPTPKPKPKVVEEIGLASVDDLSPLSEPSTPPVRKPAVSPPPPPVHKPKNPHIPPSESYLAPMSSLPPLEPIDGGGASDFTSGGKVDLFGGSDPLAVPNTGGYSVAPDPFGPSNFAASSGYGIPPGDPFAPMPSTSLPAASPAMPGNPGKKPIEPIMIILPAICQMVVHIPLLLFTMFSFACLLATFLTLVNTDLAPIVTKSMPVFILYCFLHLAAIAFYSWGIIGSVNMIQRRNYDNAIAAAWVSIIPCINPCATPFGIWALIILNDRGVKKSFYD